MSWMRVLFVMACAIVAIGPSRAAEPAKDALLEKIQAKYATVDLIEAKFTQKTVSAVLGDEQTSKGTLVVHRSGKLRWAFDNGQRYVCDGSTMWLYTPEEKQVIVRSNITAEAMATVGLLESVQNLKERFDVSIVSSDAAAGHVLSMTPKKGDGSFKRMKMEVDKDLLLRGFTFVDPFDTETRIGLSEVVLGGTAAPDVFTFQIPDGVEVVRF